MKGHRFFLVVIGLLFSLFFAELFLRLFKPQETFASLQLAFTFSCFSKGSYYWLGLKPNADCTLHSTVRAFRDIPVSTNSMGFRGPDIEPKKPGVTRLLFVGDSYTFGWGVPEELTYPQLVKKKLEERFPQKTFEVVNAGIPSTGMGWAYLLLKNELETISPDIVVVGFYPFSDVGYDTVVNRWTETDANGLPTRIESTAAYVGPGGNLRATSLPLKFKVPYLRDLHLFALIMDRFFPDDVQLDNPVISHYGTCLYKQDCKDLDPYRERVQKLLMSISGLLSEKKIAHLVAMIPSEFSVYPDVRFKYGISVPILPWEKENPTKVFDEFFAKNGIPHLPLRPVFLNHLTEKTYFERDDHWNTRGHAIAADAIADRLVPIIEAR